MEQGPRSVSIGDGERGENTARTFHCWEGVRRAWLFLYF